MADRGGNSRPRAGRHHRREPDAEPRRARSGGRVVHRSGARPRAAMGPDFNQMSGEDATALGFMAHGGDGCISVTSNVAPRLCAEFQGACLKGDYAGALKLQDKLMPLHTALFIETNPAPAKYALSVLGKCAETVRLPMVPVAGATRRSVRDA